MDSVSRRGFLGATTGAAGITAAMGEFAFAQAQDDAPAAPKEKRLKVGMLTAPFGNTPLEQVAAFAKEAQIDCLEVYVDFNGGVIDVNTFDAAKVDAAKATLANCGVTISALAYYGNSADPEKFDQIQAFMKKAIDVASQLGVPTLCANAGFPHDKMSKVQTIKRVLPKVYNPIIAYAAEKGMNIALENWFETNLQGLDCFEMLFETFKDSKNFGLNYDPSHLVHQELDYLLPVKWYGDRIFHTHAKDCLVDTAQKAKVGVYGEDWWRYVIPGYGDVNWGHYVSALRNAKYRGVMSIEHEDSAFGREEGFVYGARYLSQFC